MRYFLISMQTLDELSILSSAAVCSAVRDELFGCINAGDVIVFRDGNLIIMVCRTEEELTEFLTSKNLL